MSDHSLHDQLMKYLPDVHSIEVQALEQVKRAPQIAGDPSLARIFADHEDETREHERLCASSSSSVAPARRSSRMPPVVSAGGAWCCS